MNPRNNTGEHLFNIDYRYGHNLSDMTFKTQTNKKSISYKIFECLCINGHYQCRKRHPTERGRLVSYVSATGSAPLSGRGSTFYFIALDFTYNLLSANKQQCKQQLSSRVREGQEQKYLQRR